ncbi:MAG: hypothetical protein PHO85_07725 [Candidatus Cloacimonetes bacterium]|nr:hypothetical protein [Candidatus Cloacimonadota bacterium]
MGYWERLVTYEIGLVNWRLKILTQDTRTVLADSLFVGDQAKYEDGIYLLYGNRVCIQDNPKQLVIAEYFTFDSCPNCPVAEAKLSMMQQTHPNFIYLEHHITNALLVPDNDTPSYYSAYSAPTAVFQGMSKVVGSAAEQLQLYDNLVNNLVNEDQSIEYELQDISYDSNEIRAKVILTASPEMDINDMYLNYVIITDEVSQTNVNGDPLHNVVRAVGRSPLTAWDMQHGVLISLGTSDPMPSNYKLVVFAQYRPQVFINESRIYGGIVHTVSSK